MNTKRYDVRIATVANRDPIVHFVPLKVRAPHTACGQRVWRVRHSTTKVLNLISLAMRATANPRLTSCHLCRKRMKP